MRAKLAAILIFSALLIATTVPSHARPVEAQIPTLDIDDYNAREDCLNKTVCRMVLERGSQPDTLDAIATSATGICSYPLWTKMLIRAQRHVDGLDIDDGISQREIDRLATEREANRLATTCMAGH